ncbi:MAG: hypothetical protein JOY64_20445 [Alphaproteobacteria bacterium]|nr:hypothetical protein [Alphaproteobacteria bacterium]MBV8410009.1 hypothetical protein [Alphaproteobacteria bacterium]
MAVQTFLFADDGQTPNNPRLPMLVYPAAVDIAGQADPAVPFETLFERHGWTDGWRNGIFAFLHFHTTAHEVLGIARGQARVEFGGARGEVLTVGAGDVVVLPAGTGHRKIESSRDLLVVGAYPAGVPVDQKRAGSADLVAARSAIAKVPVPAMDPVQGREGPLVKLWGELRQEAPQVKPS